jgi:Golgi apparatus protein 1
LAACLDRAIAEHRRGNAAGRGVMDACKEDIASYKMLRNANINRDPPLARACKDDVAQFCANTTDVGDPGGEVIYCLRNIGTRLADACKKEVIRTMLEVADDYRLDPKLSAECDDAVTQHCADIEPGEGREVACLAGKTEQLAWGCLQLVLMFQKQAVSDIRLNVRLFRACLPEQQRFCASVEPGHMRVQECLEDNIDEPAFGPYCRATLDELMAQRVANFTMDEAMVDACADDLEAKCATPRDELDIGANRKAALACLQNFRDELKGADCRDKVHRQMKRAARSADHDAGLAVACAADRKRLCPGVEPGSARVIRCLQDTRERLEPDCSAALFDHEVRSKEGGGCVCACVAACACGGRGGGAVEEPTAPATTY